MGNNSVEDQQLYGIMLLWHCIFNDVTQWGRLWLENMIKCDAFLVNIFFQNNSNQNSPHVCTRSKALPSTNVSCVAMIEGGG